MSKAHMSEARTGGEVWSAIRNKCGVAASGAASLLSLAAAPTFAVMAMLTSVPGSAPGMLCSAGHHASLLSGMALMYLLMSAFHVAPWLALISGRRGGARKS